MLAISQLLELRDQRKINSKEEFVSTHRFSDTLRDSDPQFYVYKLIWSIFIWTEVSEFQIL